jgi:azurin
MKNLALVSLLATAGVLLIGCGGSDATVVAATGTSAPAAAHGARTVEISANDTMKFNVTEITAQPGEKLLVVVKNTGRMPKQAMAHNWVLLKPMTDSEVNAFGMAAASNAPSYLPADRSAILSASKMLGPNEVDRLEVTAPSQPGDYPFLCTFPGHFAIMKGKLIVK